jgi:hypothetical protein
MADEAASAKRMAINERIVALNRTRPAQTSPMPSIRASNVDGRASTARAPQWTATTAAGQIRTSATDSPAVHQPFRR